MALLEYRPIKTLYQFCSLESFRAILDSKVFWCTDLRAANDPRELDLGFEHFYQAMRDVSAEMTNGAGPFLARFVQQATNGDSLQQFFCACFSLLDDSLPMWREYGDNGKGLSIGFRPGAVTSLPGRIQKVRYLNPDTPEHFRQVVRDLAANFDKTHSPSDVEYWSHAADRILSAATALKHESWSYEEEIRFVYAQVVRDPGKDLPVSQFDDGTPIHWQEPLKRERGQSQISYLKFPFGRRRANSFKTDGAIERVIIGPKCDETIENVTAELKARGFYKVNVVKSDCRIR